MELCLGVFVCVYERERERSEREREGKGLGIAAATIYMNEEIKGRKLSRTSFIFVRFF